MRSHGADVDLTVQRCLEGRVDAAFGDTFEVRFAQRHVHDIEAVVARHPGDFAGQPERGQYSLGVVVRSSADVGDHTGYRFDIESSGAQANRGRLGCIDVVAFDQ